MGRMRGGGRGLPPDDAHVFITRAESHRGIVEITIRILRSDLRGLRLPRTKIPKKSNSADRAGESTYVDYAVWRPGRCGADAGLKASARPLGRSTRSEGRFYGRGGP